MFQTTSYWEGVRTRKIGWSLGYVTDQDMIGLSLNKGKPKTCVAVAGHCTSTIISWLLAALLLNRHAKKSFYFKCHIQAAAG